MGFLTPDRFLSDRHVIVKKLTDSESNHLSHLRWVARLAVKAARSAEKELVKKYRACTDIILDDPSSFDLCEIRGQYLIIDTSHPERFEESSPKGIGEVNV